MIGLHNLVSGQLLGMSEWSSFASSSSQPRPDPGDWVTMAGLYRFLDIYRWIDVEPVFRLR